MTAESSKIAKYSSLLPTHEVVPVVVETLGTWGEAAWKLSADLGFKSILLLRNLDPLFFSVNIFLLPFNGVMPWPCWGRMRAGVSRTWQIRLPVRRVKITVLDTY